MMVIDVLYPIFTLSHRGKSFQVKEIDYCSGRFFELHNPEDYKDNLRELGKEFDSSALQEWCLIAISVFEEEMSFCLASMDEDKELTYSEMYIKNMVGH